MELDVYTDIDVHSSAGNSQTGSSNYAAAGNGTDVYIFKNSSNREEILVHSANSQN